MLAYVSHLLSSFFIEYIYVRSEGKTKTVQHKSFRIALGLKSSTYTENTPQRLFPEFITPRETERSCCSLREDESVGHHYNINMTPIYHIPLFSLRCL